MGWDMLLGTGVATALKVVITETWFGLVLDCGLQEGVGDVCFFLREADPIQNG